MRRLGRTERRLAFAMLLVAGLPLLATLFFARSFVRQATSLFVNADVGAELERSLGVYADLAKAMKDALRAKADAIAAQEPLRAAAILGHAPSVQEELVATLSSYPDLYSLRVCKGVPPRDDDDAKAEEIQGECVAGAESLGVVRRPRAIDAATERALEVRRPLGRPEGEMGKPPPEMVAVFVAPRARLDDVARAADFVKAYRAIEQQKDEVQRSYVYGLTLIFVLTLGVALGIGSLLARQVTTRIAALATATRKVGAGDLGVRVPEAGEDEIGDLARAFNRMVTEVEDSRARIEFLRRMGAWQEMARRLAHEIKNPLTPIQLAVEEVHRRYEGDDASFRKILDTTQEIVVEEVGTLRRLVTEFSNFARLPRAELEAADLAAFLRDQSERLALGEDHEEGADALAGAEIAWRIPAGPIDVGLDPQMFHRVMANLLANAAQAIRGAGREGHVEVGVSVSDLTAIVDVDDDGPGVPEDMRLSIFDPYVTTKDDGTGLGLAIVKKIVVEHGGTIEAGESGLGGARFRIRLPRLGTPASEAAMAGGGAPSVRGAAAAYSARA